MCKQLQCRGSVKQRPKGQRAFSSRFIGHLTRWIVFAFSHISRARPSVCRSVHTWRISDLSCELNRT